MNSGASVPSPGASRTCASARPRRRKRPASALAVALAVLCIASCSKSAPEIRPTDLIQPDQLARMLADSTAAHPMLLHIGFDPLYRSGHIPNSRYVGAASKPEGLAAIKQALADVPPGQSIVLYCGCCPWTDCPNVRPAFRTALESGHRMVRVLYIEKTLEKDWIGKGFPSEKGE